MSPPSSPLLLVLVFAFGVAAQYRAAREWEKLLWKPDVANPVSYLKVGFLWGGLGVGLFKVTLWLIQAPELAAWLLNSGMLFTYLMGCVLIASAVAWSLVKHDISVKIWIAMVVVPSLLFGFDTSLLNALRLNEWQVFPLQLVTAALVAVLFYAILRLATVSLGIKHSHHSRANPHKTVAAWFKNPKNSFLSACIVFDLLLIALQYNLNHTTELSWLFAFAAFACAVYGYFLSVHSQAQTLKLQDELAWSISYAGPRGPGMALETTGLVSAALGHTDVSIFFWRAASHRKGLGSMNLNQGSVFLSSAAMSRANSDDPEPKRSVLGYLQSALHPDDYESVSQELLRYLRREIPAFKVVARVSDRQGSWKTVRGEVFATWSDLNGLPICFYGSKVDITDQTAENELLSASKLRQLRALRVIGHDLATPLGTIVMSAELMLRRAKTESLDAFTVKTIDRIKTASGLALDYLMDTLTYARSEDTAETLPVEDIALNDFIEGIVEKHLERHGLNKDKVVLDIPSGGTLMQVRRLPLEMVLSNLISNAIKYTPALVGQVFIRVKTTEADGETTSDLNHTLIEIQDEGVGIPLEFQERLFQAYQRARNVQDIQGLGLGLTIVQNGVNLLDARLGVVSQPQLDKGSLFSLKLPNRLLSQQDSLSEITD